MPQTSSCPDFDGLADDEDRKLWANKVRRLTRKRDKLKAQVQEMRSTSAQAQVGGLAEEIAKKRLGPPPEKKVAVLTWF